MAVVVLAALVAGWPANATESGGGAYPNGAEDFMAGAAPPPGTYAINYFNYYAASKFAGNNGNSAVPDFKLRVAADGICPARNSTWTISLASISAISALAWGGYYQQVTDDKLNGVTVPDKKGRVLAFGPAIKYQYKNMSASLKYDFETAALNRPEGESLWFKFIYAF